MYTCSGTPFRIDVEFNPLVNVFEVSEYASDGTLVNYEQISVRNHEPTFAAMPMFEAAMKVYLERRDN